MPRLSYPICPDGLVVDVLVGIDQSAMLALLAKGTPIPRPIRGRGLIDTGSDITVVSATTLRHLGVPARYQTTTRTVAGLIAVQLYEVSMGITDFADPKAAELVQPAIQVMELKSVLPGIEVLIDLLLTCRFSVDGPARRFNLDF